VAVLDTTNALGEGDAIGLRWIEPLPGSESLSHAVTLGADYKKFRDRLVQTGSEPIETPITYYPFSLSYGGARRDGGGDWSYSVGATWGFRGLGSSERDFNTARFGASSNFFVFKWDLQRRHELGAWGQIQAQFDGQLADQPLVSNEQYAAGGLESVRGYLQAEALGDNALRASLEWRTPKLAQSWLPRLDDLRLYAFVEGARVVRKEPLPAETASQVLSSAGLGLRLRAGERLATHFSVGWPFKDSGSGASPTTRSGKARVQFNAAVGF
jgi:hemolysin activation/secretion protein